MSKNFSFMLADEANYSESMLLQGDVLERSGPLRDAVALGHRYYAEASDYEYFLVLTPSCDLVLRDGRCKSRYISLAAIRPLSVLIERELEKYKRSVRAPGLFCRADRRDRANQFIERILNNTEEGFLFLPSELFDDGIDRCAFLHLSIALRSYEHYFTCLSAKRMQLATDFSAKVGQLTANLYGQVATSALDEQSDIDPKQIINDYKNRLLDADQIYWLSTEQERAFKKKIQEAQSSGIEISHEQAGEMYRSLPSDNEILVERILTLAREVDGLDEDMASLLKNKLLSDAVISRFSKKSG